MAAVSRKRLKMIITLLFILNFLCLLSYFINHPIPVNVHFHLHRDYLTHHHSSTTTTTDNLTSQIHLPNTPNYFSLYKSHSKLKPWPVLLSYLPWNPAPDLRHGSCEAYFGNGFTRVVDILLRQSPSDIRRKFGFPVVARTSGGWFRCHYSDTLQSSICEGGRIRMDPSKIRMSKGGERIQEVIGRKDEDELPSFEPGAFWVDGGEVMKEKKKLVKEEDLDQFVSEGEILKHTMRELIDSIEMVGGSEFECSEWVEEPTLLVTRFEYANVFHTYTDWYSAYVSSRVTGLPGRPNVVFVDGHSKTQLEETWEALFSSIRFAKNFSGPVCFRHAILSPLGYETAWFKGLSESIDCFGTSAKDLWANPNDQKTARLSEFGEMIKAAFGFQADRLPIKKSNSSINVLFVRREDYLAHPRHRGKVESRLSNELEVLESLNTWAANFSKCKINLMNGLFAHMSMKEQLRAIQDASVIIGAHGAGLTHTVSALPKTAILEIIASQYRRPHFQLIARWKGLQYHAINLGGDYAEPAEVMDRLRGILRSAGC